MSWQDAAEILRTPFFDGVRPLLQKLQGGWPTLEQLNRMSREVRAFNADGMPICFAPPREGPGSAVHYEMGIATSGEIPTRQNWHDLFNALQWLAYPLLKARLNAQHVRMIREEGAGKGAIRSAPRDVLTMFDESGIIVASADPTLLALLRNFQWHALFVERRQDVVDNMRFVLAGHGLMEKSLRPFIGLTAKAMLLDIDAAAPELDHASADWLNNRPHLDDSHNLSPLPLLGIPGWDARNESADFYQNSAYFRTGRRQT